jgi:AraC-like DNA-binding protein
MFARYRPRAGRMVMPDVCCDLVWAGERLVLLGPMTKARLSTFVGQEVQLASIDPLVARAWLGLPLAHLADRRVALEEIDRDLAGRLSDLFFAGRGVELVRPPGLAPPPEPRAAHAARAIRHGHGVRGAAEGVGLSDRQLERLFADRFGVSPRLYAGILRLRRAVGEASAGETLAGAAAIAGFADQSHFTRATRAYTGLSPGQLLPHVANVQDVQAVTRDF